MGVCNSLLDDSSSSSEDESDRAYRLAVQRRARREARANENSKRGKEAWQQTGNGDTQQREQSRSSRKILHPSSVNANSPAVTAGADAVAMSAITTPVPSVALKSGIVKDRSRHNSARRARVSSQYRREHSRSSRGRANSESDVSESHTDQQVWIEEDDIDGPLRFIQEEEAAVSLQKRLPLPHSSVSVHASESQPTRRRSFPLSIQTDSHSNHTNTAVNTELELNTKGERAGMVELSPNGQHYTVNTATGLNQLDHLVPMTPALQSWMTASQQQQHSTFTFSSPPAIPANLPGVGAKNLMHRHAVSALYTPLFVPATPLPAYISEEGVLVRRSPSPAGMNKAGHAPMLSISSVGAPFHPRDVSILLCDSDDSDAIHLEEALLAAGYSVVRCNDAGEALSLLQPSSNTIVCEVENSVTAVTSTSSSSSTTDGGDTVTSLISEQALDFDLIICSAQAGGTGISGSALHLVDILKETPRLSHLPILLSSVDGGNSLSIAASERWIRRGCTDVLHKPYLPTLVLSTVFTLATTQYQARLLTSIEQRGDQYKAMLLQQQRAQRYHTSARYRNQSHAHLSLNPSTQDGSWRTPSIGAHGSGLHKPVLLNILLLSSDSDVNELAETLLNWLGDEFLLNIIPCASTAQVLSCLENRRDNGEIATPNGLPFTDLSCMESGLSATLIGPLGADLLLMDENSLCLSGSDEDLAFIAALTSRDSGNNNGSSEPQHHSTTPGHILQGGSPAASPSVSLPSAAQTQGLMVPIMVLTDSDSSAPPLKLLTLLQRSLVGVLEMPLSQGIVLSKLQPFLTAVLQHRRRFQLAQRAQAYRLLLQQMRSNDRSNMIDYHHRRSFTVGAPGRTAELTVDQQSNAVKAHGRTPSPRPNEKNYIHQTNDLHNKSARTYPPTKCSVSTSDGVVSSLSSDGISCQSSPLCPVSVPAGPFPTNSSDLQAYHSHSQSALDGSLTSRPGLEETRSLSGCRSQSVCSPMGLTGRHIETTRLISGGSHSFNHTEVDAIGCFAGQDGNQIQHITSPTPV
jgi:CheY-like chemotaxis protein